MVLPMALLAQSLKVIPVATGYAVWAGIVGLKIFSDD